jgi:hypothetical protein
MLGFKKKEGSRAVGILEEKFEKKKRKVRGRTKIEFERISQRIYLTPDDNKGDTKIDCKRDERIFPACDKTKRDVFYVAGSSGSGKSTFVAQYIYDYKKMFPRNKVYVFSRLNEDPVFDDLNVVRVPITDDIEDIDLEIDLRDSLIVFDDIDTIQDKQVREMVYHVLNDALEAGRKLGIYICSTSHLINGNDRKNCRTILNECTSITVFPRSGCTHQISYALKNYFGISNQTLEKIMNLPSRWVTIFKNYPTTVMHEKGVFLV